MWGLLLNIPRHADEKDNTPTAQIPNKKDFDVNEKCPTNDDASL